MELFKPSEFAIAFIQHYDRHGFGNMNKNDFEVLIFHLLKEYGNLSESTDNYSISRMLKIPETKVRRLAYEADLKYQNFQQHDVTKMFFELLNESTLRADTQKIEFVIESRFLRSSISAQLKMLGHYSDSSFNSELIRIHIDSFVDLLHHYYGEKVVQRIVKSCENMIEPNSSDKSLFHTLMKEFLKGAAAQSGKSSIKLVELKLTGGLSGVSDIIGFIKSRS